MTIQEAIETAIQYEQKIRDLYGEAAREAFSPEVKRFFQLLSEDEQSHFVYLTEQLGRWEANRKLTLSPIHSIVPVMGGVEKQADIVKEKLSEEVQGDVTRALSMALKAEVETSDFYRRLTEEFSDDAKEMFAGFLAIEENHVVAVQTELDYLNKSGHFFDVREFAMER